jgi:hypothetical protein
VLINFFPFHAISHPSSRQTAISLLLTTISTTRIVTIRNSRNCCGFQVRSCLIDYTLDYRTGSTVDRYTVFIHVRPLQVLWQILVQNLLVHPRSFYTTGTFSLGCVMSAAFLSRRGPFVNTKLALISDLDLFAIVSGHVYVDVTLAS